MKGYLGSQKCLFFFLICLCWLASVRRMMSGGSEYHSFDSLFPKTWYTKAVESCTQVWGAFDDLRSRSSISPANKSIVLDAAIGRLVFAQLCLDLISNTQEHAISNDDVIYLSRVIDIVEERYVKLADSIETDRSYCLRRVIDDLKRKVQSFMLQDV